MLIKMTSQKELSTLAAEFKKVDTDGTGMIDREELTTIFQRAGIEMSAASVDNIICELDYQGNGMINYSEFLAATVDLDKFADDGKLRAVFNQLDTDQTNKLTADNIMFAMRTNYTL